MKHALKQSTESARVENKEKYGDERTRDSFGSTKIDGQNTA